MPPFLTPSSFSFDSHCSSSARLAQANARWSSPGCRSSKGSDPCGSGNWWIPTRVWLTTGRIDGEEPTDPTDTPPVRPEEDGRGTTNAPLSVQSFARQHQNFPCDSTLDQLYDADRFDAYRELGAFSVGQALLPTPVQALESRRQGTAASTTSVGVPCHPPFRLLSVQGQPVAPQ